MHTGPREEQEDCLLVASDVMQVAEMRVPLMVQVAAEADLLVVVSDGMGGHARGQWASRFVCEQLAEQPLTPTPEVIEARLREIQLRMEEQAGWNGRRRAVEGATVVGLLRHAEGVTIFNAGDSRIYHRPEGGALTQLTHDHTLVQSLLDHGKLTPEEVADYPYRNVLEFGLGSAFASLWKGGRYSCRVRTLPDAGGVWLVCSDGVHGALAHAELEALLASPSPESAAHLAQRVWEESTDNFSFVLLWEA
ncbi:PP2C family protein-serine/threonine phosphatase [Candidatus Magnetaquiglobus chichijimensis]